MKSLVSIVLWLLPLFQSPFPSFSESASASASTSTSAQATISNVQSNSGEVCEQSLNESEQMDKLKLQQLQLQQEQHGAEESCQDNVQDCNFWASEGECENNPNYMLAHCKLSCRVCELSETEDSNEKCPLWAAEGECSLNPDYMLHYCRNSCKNYNKTSKERKWLEAYSSNKLAPGEIAPVYWKTNTDTPIAENLYRISLPQELRQTLFDYISSMGILSQFQSILLQHDDEPSEALILDDDDDVRQGAEQPVQFQYEKWLVQRPPKRWQSNMHWISPREEYAQQSYLRALSKGKFDSVLDSIGHALEMDGLFVYHITFIGVSHCTKGFQHLDFQDTNKKAFNLIIPLVLVPESNAELELCYGNTCGHYQYQYEEGILLGDQAIHATAAVDYLSKSTDIKSNDDNHRGQMRIMATIYLADISSSNVDGIIEAYTQEYPPIDRIYLLSAKHWKSSNKSVISGDGEGDEDIIKIRTENEKRGPHLPRDTILTEYGFLRLYLVMRFYLKPGFSFWIGLAEQLFRTLRDSFYLS